MKETEQVNHILMTHVLHNLIWGSFLRAHKTICKPPTALFNTPSCRYTIGPSLPSQVRTATSGIKPAACSVMLKALMWLSIDPPRRHQGGDGVEKTPNHTRKRIKVEKALMETLSPVFSTAYVHHKQQEALRKRLLLGFICYHAWSEPSSINETTLSFHSGTLNSVKQIPQLVICLSVHRVHSPSCMDGM